MKVDRLPSRGETLLGRGYREDFGGKGSNQAVCCARLGAQVTFLAKLGKDSFGDRALELYREEHVDARFVQQTTLAPTGVGFISVEAGSGSNCIVLDPGANEFLSADDLRGAEPAFTLPAVVLTQLEIPVPTAECALARGRATGAVTILNPAPVRPLERSILEQADIVTPNEAEAKILTGRSPSDSAEPDQLARELLSLGAKTVVVTLGEKGALVVDAASCVHVPAIQVLAVDTTGAGDAFNAGLATALSFDAALEDAVRFAVVTGGLAVTKEGVIPALPTRADVLSFYRQHDQTPPPWLGLPTLATERSAT